MTHDRRLFQAAGAWIGACFHTFVFAAYPVLIVLGANAGVLPMHFSVVARSLAMAGLCTLAILLALKPLIPEIRTRAAFLSFMFIAFAIYAIVGGTSMHAGLASGYTIASVGFALLMVRPWTRRERKSRPLNLGACAVIAANLYVFVPAAADREAWRPAADALIGDIVASTGTQRPDQPRDIYYLIVDGFGRPDILKDRYNVDLDSFVAALATRGFDVPSRAQSNYAQTFLSIGSSLNLTYLDPLASVMSGSGDRRALYYLIQNNALMKLAKREGYRVMAIGSDYAATERLDGADHCHCEQFGLHEIEATALNLTPLRALPLQRWTYGAHRHKVEESFRHLRAAAAGSGPKLVFAHVLAPHPPFVFGPDGRVVSNESRMFSFSDGSQFSGSPGEYAAEYGHQARFVADQVLRTIDEILARPGPSPVIIVHGDHGPGSTWDWDELRGDKGRARMGIFSAYRLPGEDRPALAANTTPVNALRVIANRYLRTALPPLPDVSYASTWKEPYKFEVVQPVAAVASSQ